MGLRVSTGSSLSRTSLRLSLDAHSLALDWTSVQREPAQQRLGGCDLQGAREASFIFQDGPEDFQENVVPTTPTPPRQVVDAGWGQLAFYNEHSRMYIKMNSKACLEPCVAMVGVRTSTRPVDLMMRRGPWAESVASPLSVGQVDHRGRRQRDCGSAQCQVQPRLDHSVACRVGESEDSWPCDPTATSTAARARLRMLPQSPLVRRMVTNCRPHGETKGCVLYACLGL